MIRSDWTVECVADAYTDEDLMLYWKSGDESLSTDDRISLSQFLIQKFHTTSRLAFYSSTGWYNRLYINFTLRRHIFFFLLQTYFPATLMVMLSWVSFWIDRRAVPARVSLGITTVLTMSTIITGVNASMPRVSYIKAVDIYLWVSFVFVFLSVLEYAAVNYLSTVQDRRERKMRERARSQSLPCTCGISQTRTMTMLDGTYSEADTNSLAGYTEEPMVPDEEQEELHEVPEKPEHMVVHLSVSSESTTTKKKKSLRALNIIQNTHAIDKYSRMIFPGSYIFFNLIYCASFSTTASDIYGLRKHIASTVLENSGPALAMTQQEQQEFTESVEVALSWMQAIQERLRANDNTQGPRDALEARLRETEKIHLSEHEGRVKMEVALVAAEVLLQSGDEELRNHTHAKLKDLKSQWEETCTYIIHCHSRIEWVWLHWSEYLKAYEEFELWLTRQQRSLDVRVELQLGVKEKLWQVDQQRVAVSDVHNQATLLERLLDEAAALHNRTQDPSVEPQAQERLQEAYNDVRDRAEKMAEEHQTYQGSVQRFQSWLLSKTKELTDLMEKEDTAENKLKALQALDDSVAAEEKTLQHIEGRAEAVRANTSPAGAEMVVEEAEELRLGWLRLRQGLCEAEDGLRSSLDSHSQYMARCQRLGEDINRLRVLMQGLDQELEGSRQAGDRADCTEEQILGQWKKYTTMVYRLSHDTQQKPNLTALSVKLLYHFSGSTECLREGVRNALAGEESQVELLKAQLKELFRFSGDSRHLSDDVLAIVKEHQSVKCRATRLCSESESGLRSILQDPLLVYAQWSHMVSQVLEASAEVTDFSHIAMLVQNIEHLLKDSVQLQERLSLLQVKGDLLDSVFGPEKSDGLQDELNAAIRNRELLHNQLLQRKSRLQGLISRTKDFGDAYELIRSKLSTLRDRLMTAGGPQPDILAKKSQSDQFRHVLSELKVLLCSSLLHAVTLSLSVCGQVIQKDLEECEAHIIALETLVSSSQSYRTQFERLYAEWRQLHKDVRRALGEFPEKELQLQQMEVQAQGVLEKTSEEGQVHILRDIKRLQESWFALYNMSLNLHRLLNSSTEQTESDLWRVGGVSVDNMSLTSELSLGLGDSQVRAGSSRSQRGQQQDKLAEGYGALARSGPGRGGSLEGEAEEEMMMGQARWIQGQGEGHLILTGQNNEHLSTSRTNQDSGRSFIGDEVDSAWSIRRRAGQKVSKDSTADGSPDSDTPTWGDSSILTTDRGATAFTTKEGRMSSGQGSMEAGEGLSPGGGAFMVFRRDTAKQQTTPTQHTLSGKMGRASGPSIIPHKLEVHEKYCFSLVYIWAKYLHSKRAQNDWQLVDGVCGVGADELSVVLQRGTGQYTSRRREFEAWLSRQNEILSGILSTRGATLSAKELKIRHDTLKALRGEVAWGQEQFQLLLQESQSSGAGPAEDQSLEELRYRWMLYKSKMKDVGDVRARTSAKRVKAKQEEEDVTEKVQKRPGLLQRVCRLALPLWLLLLALLLLAFLLPLMDEGNSCSLSNNFARSFKIMLRYDGPPPT
ncbi:Gamma-aminobutyric acid receptor subunit rho-2 GABA(A) receptor subunit rho-2 GABA(C) receptor [Collichthys lucidus]|uniref:Gamma-aminobutyric acid receptor subunit rho-2 GABA(A) receptor subunit rho-2 GABA(C) receptor n=1 Tax=Collichthys lucidus TaxID=240159 RepID=A0A4V6AUM1_COLLU|nr:Gamma-aminobutyric acid receptor subunit rho-2 GABA(A) receptor subunit rho-2 GABA(C) receptor [Collichthys lucidus]